MKHRTTYNLDHWTGWLAMVIQADYWADYACHCLTDIEIWLGGEIGRDSDDDLVEQLLKYSPVHTWNGYNGDIDEPAWLEMHKGWERYWRPIFEAKRAREAAENSARMEAHAKKYGPPPEGNDLSSHLRWLYQQDDMDDVQLEPPTSKFLQLIRKPSKFGGGR